MYNMLIFDMAIIISACLNKHKCNNSNVNMMIMIISCVVAFEMC